MTDCIFCRMIAGEAPCARIYEDAVTLAFLDIAPLIEGHTLVIPKQHIDPLTAASPDILAACMQTVRRVMIAQQQAWNADGINLHQANGAAAGQAVPHLHFHVVPRFKNDGHHWNWQAGAYAGTEAMQAKARQLADACKEVPS